MKNILVTGGAGFIGSNLIKRLLDLDYNIVSIDNFDPFYDRKIKEANIRPFFSFNNFQHFEGNILDKNFLSELFKKNKFDLVIHLAAKAGVRPSLMDPAGYFETNVMGTINILNEMKENNVKKMLFASSSSVYGNNKKLPFGETDNVDNPISPYAASKKSCELVCSTYNALYDLDIFAFRFFTVYGPAQRPEMAIAKFANLILNNKPITLYDGAGSTARDYTYIDDIIDGMIKSIERVNGFEIFNLGESQTVKLLELVNLLEKHLNKKAEIVYGERQPGDVEITFADIDKSKKLLDYNPKIKIEEGIKKYCEWLLNNSL